MQAASYSLLFLYMFFVSITDRERGVYQITTKLGPQALSWYCTNIAPSRQCTDILKKYRCNIMIVPSILGSYLLKPFNNGKTITRHNSLQILMCHRQVDSTPILELSYFKEKFCHSHLPQNTTENHYSVTFRSWITIKAITWYKYIVSIGTGSKLVGPRQSSICITFWILEILTTFRI